MTHGRRRHVKGPAVPVRSVVTWGVVGLGAGLGLLIGFGVPWHKALLGTGGLLLVLLAAYAVERAGLMRPPAPERPGRRDRLPPAAPGGPPREPPMP